MKINILGYVLIAFVLIICIKIYLESDSFHLKCIVSDIDGNKYKFHWIVEKVMNDGKFKNCWMTTSVSLPIPIAKST